MEDRRLPNISEMETQPPPNLEAVREEEPNQRGISHPDVGNERDGGSERQQRQGREYIPCEDDADLENLHEDHAANELQLRSNAQDVHASNESPLSPDHRQLETERIGRLDQRVATTSKRMMTSRSPAVARAQRRFSSTPPGAQLGGDSTVRFFLENMQKTLLMRMDSFEATVKHFQKDLETVRNGMNSLVMNSGTSLVSRSKSKRISKAFTKWSFKDMVDAENRTLKSQVESAFDISLMSEVLSDFICHFMEYAWSRGVTLAHTHLAMSAFLYGHQKNSTKKELGIGLARVHCDFKFRFVRNIFVQGHKQAVEDCARKNESQRRLGAVETGGVNRVNNGSDNHAPSSSVPLPHRRVPYWIDPRYVGRDFMKTARELVETRAKPQKKDVDTAKGREGLYIVHTVYAMSTDFLRESRVAARKRFFEDIGFALRPWEAIIGIPEDFGQPNVSFKYPEHSSNFFDHIVSATTSEAPNADDLNSRSLQELVSSRLELGVVVDYYVLVGDVLLKNGGQKRGFKPAERKLMYRNINLARVAVNFLWHLRRDATWKSF